MTSLVDALFLKRKLDAGMVGWLRHLELDDMSLGRCLVRLGTLSVDEMSAELAECWGVPLVDLRLEPHAGGLISKVGLGPRQWSRWVPWREEEGVLFVLTSVPPSEALRVEVGRWFPEHQILFCTASWPSVEALVETELREHHVFEIAEGFASDQPERSAKEGLRLWQKVVPIVVGLGVGASLVLDWQFALVALMALANITFALNASFKLLGACFRPAWPSRADPFFDRTPAEPAARVNSLTGFVASDEYPVYTILVPVYQEANVISRVFENLEQINYPRSKLDVLVLLEESDTATIEAARAANPPAYARLLVVPDGLPRTKPRACNYGLLFARGDYLVILDAEDRIDKDQLLDALAAFRHDDVVRPREARPLACVQAALAYYNADYNVLTRMFAIEYAHWFDSMLPGLDSTGVAIPLGGTSNHFRLGSLREVGGWDPYNVTEDADLGLRLAASGYRVEVMRSTTWEEATAKVGPWIRQRTRWIKGYMLTAAVNLRRPLDGLRHNGWRGSLSTVGLILSTPVAFLLYPLMLGFTLACWLLSPVLSMGLPPWLTLLGLVNMLGLNLLMVTASGIAAWRRYNWRIAAFAVFLPIYWLLHSCAAWRAAMQVGLDPHRWEKTPHGVSED